MKKYVFIIISCILSSCASVYITKEGQALADKHQVVAILGPKVGFKAKRNVDSESLKEAQRTTSIEIQNEIYKFMLKRKQQGYFKVDIQDVEETNVILRRSNYDGYNLTTSEICKLLEVDAVIFSNFNLAQPTSQGAAIAASVLLGVNTATNKASASMSIKDCSNNSMIWNYDHKFSGGIGSSSARLVESLMRNASKKMPYFNR